MVLPIVSPGTSQPAPTSRSDDAIFTEMLARLTQSARPDVSNATVGGVVEDAASGAVKPTSAARPPLVIAKEWGDKEGLFVNRTDRPVIVFRDVYDDQGRSLGVKGTTIPPGGRGLGDGVLIDADGDGRLSASDKVFKVPNNKFGDARYDIVATRVPGERIAVIADPETSAVPLLAGGRALKPGQYGYMSVQQFFNVMGQKPMTIDGRPFFSKEQLGD